MRDLKPETLLVKAGRPHGPGQPLNTPIVPSSNFVLGEGKVYSREDGTSTWQALEEVVGELEQGQAIAYASGMAAAAAAFEQVPQGGQVVLPSDCYQGVLNLALAGEAQGRWRLLRLATEDTDAWCAAAGHADMLWLETPSNPLLLLADLNTIAAAPRAGLLVVDNTFATPLLQRPLTRGADLVLHSATKYIGGHSDLLGGLLVARDPTLAERLVLARKLQGATPGMLEAYLAARGVRTLAVRLERAQHNAARLAAFLEAHPQVHEVRYPGLSSHPQHALARQQLDGFGAMLTFLVQGDGATADALCAAVQIINHATSLGSVESTMERRSVYAGAEHLPPNLLRLSVGIEAVEDLEADLAAALQRVSAA